MRRPRQREFGTIDHDWTVISIDEETEEIFESRAYRFRSGPETFSFILRSLAETMGERLAEVPGDDLAYYIASMIERERIKFLAKRRKEDGLITYVTVAIGRDSRRLLDRQELVEEADYRQAVEELEERFVSRAILSTPAVVTLEDWRRYAEKGHLSTREDGGE